MENPPNEFLHLYWDTIYPTLISLYNLANLGLGDCTSAPLSDQGLGTLRQAQCIAGDG
ncbi:MAG: hypothetical protein HEQ35_15610 [Gloeotrichia echinulata IR180]